MDKFSITIHVLNLHEDKLVANLISELHAPQTNRALSSTKTNKSGCIMEWLTRFDQQGRNNFFSNIEFTFNSEKLETHYHVPLLLNRFGFSSYRGS